MRGKAVFSVFKKHELLLSALLVLPGCSNPQMHAEIVKLEGYPAYTITYPAELRGAYFFRNGSTLKYCAEPAPDVALDTLQKLTTSLTATLADAEKVGGKLATELSAEVVQLAGRTELLLLAREMLYRACELSLNGTTASEASMNLYERVAQLIENLSKADKVSAQADLAREKAALEAAGRAFD